MSLKEEQIKRGEFSFLTENSKASTNLANHFYYYLKPLMPRSVQLGLRRMLVAIKRKKYRDIWPIDERAGKQPDGWVGWPEDKRFALVLTHDVDTGPGQKKLPGLVSIEGELGFKASYNFVPERYKVSAALRKEIEERGFEIGLHGLKHDGKLFRNRRIFLRRAVRINDYMKKWRIQGFRSPAMHHNLKWILELDIKYDASTFDTDPFEPKPEGCGTIFPFWVEGNSLGEGYVELPYTLPQDFTLFVLMKERNINIWKRKLDWIAEKGGMALLNTHPDYMNFDGKKLDKEEYPVRYYKDFLSYVKDRYDGQYWHVLPRDIARFWKENMVEKRTED